MRTMAFEVPQVSSFALTEHVSWLEVVADLDVVGAEKEQEFAKVRALHGSLCLLQEGVLPVHISWSCGQCLPQ